MRIMPLDFDKIELDYVRLNDDSNNISFPPKINPKSLAGILKIYNIIKVANSY